MSSMSLSEYKSLVLLMLGNIPQEQPIIAAGMRRSAINNGANRLIRENPDMFPEHHGRSWTVGPTLVPNMTSDPIVEGNRIPIPDNLLELQRVTRNASSTDPEAWQATQEFIVPMPSNAVHVIGLSDKTTEGYPLICGRKDSDLIYWPTTSTDYTCYFRLYGVSREEELVDEADTFVMDRDWDQVIVMYAASELAEAMGWIERAQELLTMANTRIKQRGGVMARERAQMPIRARIAGMP